MTVIPPLLSRRIARAKYRVRDELTWDQLGDLGPACEGASTFEELPEWVQAMVLRAESLPAEDTEPAALAADDDAAPVIEPGAGGDPSAPQPCQLGEEPAVRSLLFRDGDAYSPTCDEHEEEIRVQLEQAGETVSGVVDIGGDAEAVTAAADAVVPADVDEDAGELRVEFPLIVIEGFDTSDGRYLEPGSLTLRALPLTLHVQFENSHGGQEPGPSIAVGRVDEMVRRPGPEVISPRTGEPYPEGSFVWSGAGAISTTAQVQGNNVAEWVRRRFLRGVSADLAGMEYDLLGEDGYADVDPDNPRRELVTHSAEFAGLTIVSVPAFGDCYIQLPGDEAAMVEPTEDLPAELVASAAVPSWRSAEVGDYAETPGATAAPVVSVDIPSDAVAQLVQVIDSGEHRDADQLAADVLAYITGNWGGASGAGEDKPEPAPEEASMADSPDLAEVDPAEGEPLDTGIPDVPQPCQFGPEPAVRSLLFADGSAYVPVCDEHEQAARDQIAAMGDEVSDVIDIGESDPTEAAE